MEEEIKTVALPEPKLTEDLFEFLEEINSESHLDIADLGVN